MTDHCPVHGREAIEKHFADLFQKVHFGNKKRIAKAHAQRYDLALNYAQTIEDLFLPFCRGRPGES